MGTVKLVTEAISNIGAYGKFFGKKVKLSKLCQDVIKQDYARSGAFCSDFKTGVLDRFVSQRTGTTVSIVRDDFDTFRKVVERKDGVRFDHYLRGLHGPDSSTTITSAKGAVTTLKKKLGNIMPGDEIVNRFSLEGQKGVKYSTGSLGNPVNNPLSSDLTPEQSNFLRDYILGRHNKVDDVNKIWQG